MIFNIYSVSGFALPAVLRCPQGFLAVLLTPFPFSPPLLQMPGGRCSPCHPTTAVRSLPVPPGLPFCPASKECPQSASSAPSPHSEPAAAIRQTPLFPSAPRARAGCERQRGARGRGAPEHRRGQSPLPASEPPLLPFSHISGRDRGCAGGEEPEGTGDGRGGTDGDWEQSPGVAHDAAGSPARLTRDIYYIIILFFSGETVLCFLVWFCFVGFLVFFFPPFGGKK